MMLVLGLETSADACGVALVRDGAVVARARLAMSRGHAEALVPMVRRVMEDAGFPLSALDLVGVSVGPGSFTGVRTGLAAARGFALGCGARAVGVSALAAVALRAFADCPGAAAVVCVLETRRSDYFVQAFRAGPVPASAPAVADAAAAVALAGDMLAESPAGSVVLAGNAAARLADECGRISAQLPPGLVQAPGDGMAEAADIATLASHAAAGCENGLEDTLAPLYLRSPEAKLPAKGGRLRK